MTNRIEFYKNRNIGERFSVAFDFLKQNWKVLYKNILIGGLPLAIIMGFLLTRQNSMQYTAIPFGFILPSLLSLLMSFLTVVYMYSMTASILLHYDRNQLTETTGWDDLKETFFRFTGKTSLITLLLFIPLLIIIGIIGAIFYISFSSSWDFYSDANMGIVGLQVLFIILISFLFIGAIIAFAPSFTILYFPALFSGKGILQSIKMSFVLGFKNWGSLFVAILLYGILMIIVYVIFSAPFQVITVFSGGNLSIISFIFATFSTIGNILTYPIMVLIFAFQYFSIVEKEEGISLKSQLDEFENL